MTHRPSAITGLFPCLPEQSGHRWAARILAFVLGSASICATAESVTEVLSLSYRDAADIVPVLRPLVPAPGVIRGLSDQLVVRTSPDNLAQIKRILAELDKAPRTLLITVRQGFAEAASRRSIEGSVSSRATAVRAYATRGAHDEDHVYELRVLEGREAFIRSGKTRATPGVGPRITSDGLVRKFSADYEQVDSGVYVRPRLNGRSRVSLEISPRQYTAHGRGSFETGSHTLATTVAGRLGEWISLGGVSRTANRAEKGVIGYSTRHWEDSRRDLSVRVQLLAD